MATIKLILMVIMHFIEGLTASINQCITYSGRDIHYSFNQTFFTGSNSKQVRDSFVIDYNKLVKKYRINVNK